MGLADKLIKLQTRTRSGKLFKNVDFLVNSAGEPIHCKYWKPRGKPKALIMLVHGYGEHCGRYDGFAKQLNTIGFLAFSNDHVRHGENPGDFDIVDYKQFIKDSLQHVHIMKAKHPHLPMYIFGHSMGGCISVFAASQAPELFKGVILSAPMLAVRDVFTRSKVVLGSVLYTWFPQLPVGRPEPELLTRDQKVLEQVLLDPLIYNGPVRLRAAHQLYRMAVNVQPCLGKITHPLLILHGGDDEVCDISGSHKLLDEAKSEDKKMRTFDGAKHTLLYETENVPVEFVKEVTSWLKKRLDV